MMETWRPIYIASAKLLSFPHNFIKSISNRRLDCIKLYELLLSFLFIGPAMLSITSRCLTLAFAFPGESKNSDETRPGKVNPWDTLKLKADTLKWRLKISKPNLVLLLFDSSHLIVALLVQLKKEGRPLSWSLTSTAHHYWKRKPFPFSMTLIVIAWHGEVNYLSIKDTTAACGAYWNPGLFLWNT